ncbi:hypothetical protein Tco_1452722, partial [Tanacetum coccineum]
HGDMIIIFGAVVKSSLKLSALWLSCSWIYDALAVRQGDSAFFSGSDVQRVLRFCKSSSGSSTVGQWVRLHPLILYQLPTRVFIPVSSSDIEKGLEILGQSLVLELGFSGLLSCFLIILVLPDHMTLIKPYTPDELPSDLPVFAQENTLPRNAQADVHQHFFNTKSHLGRDDIGSETRGFGYVTILVSGFNQRTGQGSSFSEGVFHFDHYQLRLDKSTVWFIQLSEYLKHAPADMVSAPSMTTSTTS